MRRFSSASSPSSFFVLSLSLCASLAAGCSSKAALVGQGGTCELATDCDNGLICVPQKNGTSICSNNLSGVQMLAPTPDAAIPPLPPDDAAAGSGDDGSAPIEDTGAPAKSAEAGKTD